MGDVIPGQCPEPDELGRAGWTILHTAAAVFPNNPNNVQVDGMQKFIEGWSQVYACSHCAYHMRQHVQKHPPIVKNKREASWYVCDMHNKVNKILDKEQFDCSPDVVLKRWHPSYPHMEDTPTIEEQIATIRKEEASKASKEQRASASNVGGGGGFFSSIFRRQQQDSSGATSNAEPVIQKQQPPPPQEQQIIAGRQVPVGKLSEVPEHELTADPLNHSRWGDKPVIDQSERRTGAMRSGWNTNDTTPNAYAFSPGTQSSALPKTSEREGTTETDIADIMKKVRACAVYCPEKDKNKMPGLGH